MTGMPCTNPNCSSHGRPHPNCQCYDSFAEGGKVSGCQCCSEPSPSGVAMYADGGPVHTNEHPNDTIGHAAVNHGLLGLLQGKEYLPSADKGRKRLKREVGGLLGHHKASDRMEADEGHRERLSKHLEAIEEDPTRLLEAGQSVDPSMPAHSIAVGVHAANAVNFLKAAKPASTQNNPLDTVTPPSKMSQAKYNRHLDVAQNPLLVLQHIKDGNLRPQDVSTLQNLFPGLYKTLQSQVGEQMIDAKTKGIDIPYSQKKSLSLFLGQPMDSTMTPYAMQAIIKSAAAQQSNRQQQRQPHQKATEAELKQVDKVDSLYQTPLEARQANRNKG